MAGGDQRLFDFLLIATHWRLECLFLLALAGAAFRQSDAWKRKPAGADYAYVGAFIILILVNEFNDRIWLSDDGRRLLAWFASIDVLAMTLLVGVVWLAAAMFGFHQLRELHAD